MPKRKQQDVERNGLPDQFVTVSITLPKDLLQFVDSQADAVARATRRPANRSALISDWIFKRSQTT